MACRRRETLKKHDIEWAAEYLPAINSIGRE